MTPHTGWRRPPPRGDAVRAVAIDMCTIYASAVRRMLPGAQLVVDLFHVVHLAVKMTGDVRRRVVRGKYGRRGRSGDPEYGVKGLLVRNLRRYLSLKSASTSSISAISHTPYCLIILSNIKASTSVSSTIAQ